MIEEETWDDDPSWREYDPTEGTTKHKCWHRDGIVWLANGDDDYYKESFKSRAELEVFIAKLRACADECWSKIQKENVVYSVYPAKDLPRLTPEIILFDK